jgi:hypothetical protein
MKKNTTKTEILEAFEKSEKKTIAAVCQIVGITPSTFHYHAGRDSDFRRQILSNRLDYLAAKLAVETTNGGKNND